MKIALSIILLTLSIIYCDILQPKDNFKDINYEEDMGICIGATSNNTNMTEYEKFQAFIQHQCHPLVVIEGVEGTKLQLKITDCDQLSDAVLQNCNIMTEKNKHRFIFYYPPNLIKCQSNVSELLVWIALTDAAGAIGSGQCLAALFGGQLDLLSSYYQKEPPYIIPDVPGVEITWYGNTQGTMNDSQCGLKAGEDLAAEELPVDYLMDFQALYDYALGMGYQPGLTILPIPYDWRRMAGNHETTTSLQRSIEYAFTITGKKVVIAAHSFGCLAFLSLMNSFTQQFKDQYIESFVGMACAWGGSSTAIGDFVQGEKLGWWKFGFPLDDQRPIISSITSYFDLQPKPFFSTQTEWGKAINERALLEQNWNSSQVPSNISFPWFPTPENDCFLSRSDDHLCGLHIYNFFSNPIVYTPNNTYMVNQTSIIDLLNQYMMRTQAEIDFQKQIDAGNVTQAQQEATWGTNKLIPKDRIQLMMQMAYRNGAQRLINPGVKIHHVYGGNIPTNTWYNITGNPRQSTDQGKLPTEDQLKIFTHWGDSTVNIDNAIIPSLKWSWDFDNNVTNAKPVHLIDYCSNYSQLMYKDSTGKYTTNFTDITQNTYSGIMCNNYTHSKFPDDEFIDKFLASIIKQGNVGMPLVNLTESDVNMILLTCPHVMAPWTSQNFTELYQYGIDLQNLQQNKKVYDNPFSEPSQEFINFLAAFYDQLEEIGKNENFILN